MNHQGSKIIGALTNKLKRKITIIRFLVKSKVVVFFVGKNCQLIFASRSKAQHCTS